jgi:hypothetical protein
MTSFKQKVMTVVSKGVPVTPVDPSGDGKKAFLPDWPMSATTDITKIDEWNKMYEGYNYGSVATGKPDGIWFLELDSPDVLVRIQKETGHDLVEEVQTFMVRSRIGRGHLYFKNNAASLSMGNLSQTFVKNGDFSGRVFNAYVVGPGSRRVVDGKEIFYEVVANNPIIEAPQWLIDWLSAQKVQKTSKAGELPRDANNLIQHGFIHGFLVTTAGRLRNLGLGGETLEKALLDIAHLQCAPPLDDAKIRQVAFSFEKYERGSVTDIILNQKPDVIQPAVAAPVDISKWRDQFRTVGQMDDGPIDEIIKGVLQEGVCFIGANPGDGKTLVSLAFAKSICTGTPLFGLSGFSVEKPRMVIYLIPESRDRAFRRRLEAFRIPDDPTKFLCRTTSVGKTLELGDPYLMQAVRETNAVVFLDTAARFMKTNDENSAAQNQALVNDVFSLLQSGAVAVVLVHHATKASANEVMTLENMLRGTGDFAAMCDQAYGIRKDRTLYANGNGPMEIQLVSLKDREQTGELTSLLLAASRKSTHSIFPTASIIDETGNFQVIDKTLARTREIDALLTLVKQDPTITAKELAAAVGDKERAVKDKLAKVGWHCAVGGAGGRSPWHMDEDGKCPFEKKDAVEVKPSKKTFDLTLNDAIVFLKKLLTGTSPDGELVYESEVYQEADKQGIPDTLIAKARKRLGVVIDTYEDQKVWSLPASVTEAQEAPEAVLPVTG